MAAVGGGSNAIGLFHPVIGDEGVRLVGVEAAGHGIPTGRHAASLSGGRPGVLHGNKTYLLQDADGQIIDAHSISAGLDCPGIGPEHAHLHDTGRAEYVSATDDEALEMFQLRARLEGIIPRTRTRPCAGPDARSGQGHRQGRHRGDEHVRTRRQGHLRRRRPPGGQALSSNRLAPRFAALKAENRAAFVAYVMAGDPDAETAFEILKGLPGAGADVIELGFPFSDPMAEGPPIQRASLRALKAGMTLNGTLDLVSRFREGDADTPVVLMGYLNPLLTHGLEAFARDAAEAGVDGLIVVDCPPEEADPLADALESNGVSLIRLATPTTDDHRLEDLRWSSAPSGFVYYVSVAGVTGVKEADADLIAPAVARVRAASGLPVAVGFGIKTPARAAEQSGGVVADGAVVGSVLVDKIAEALSAGEPVAPKVLETAASLAKAVRSARLAAAEA